MRVIDVFFERADQDRGEHSYLSLSSKYIYSQVLVTHHIYFRDSRRLRYTLYVEMRNCEVNGIIREIAKMYVEHYANVKKKEKKNRKIYRCEYLPDLAFLSLWIVSELGFPPYWTELFISVISQSAKVNVRWKIRFKRPTWIISIAVYGTIKFYVASRDLNSVIRSDLSSLPWFILNYREYDRNALKILPFLGRSSVVDGLGLVLGGADSETKQKFSSLHIFTVLITFHVTENEL